MPYRRVRDGGQVEPAFLGRVHNHELAIPAVFDGFLDLADKVRCSAETQLNWIRLRGARTSPKAAVGTHTP